MRLTPLFRMVSLLFLWAALGTAPPVSAQQKLYVSNLPSTAVKSVDGNGIVTLFTTSELDHPRGVAFDRAGNLYVSNINNAIVKFPFHDGALSPVGTIFTTSNLSQPVGMAFDSMDNLYVANEHDNTITKFACVNGSLSASGTTFTDKGLSVPYSLAFDRVGNLYVANNGNGTITKYTFRDSVLSPMPTFFDRGLGNPTGLAFDSAGSLYVAGYGIMKYACTGGVLSTTGVKFNKSKQRTFPAWLLDDEGDLFVSTLHGNSITMYEFSNGALSPNGETFASDGLKDPIFLAFSPAPAPKAIQ